MKIKTPIALIVYNRPLLTAKVFEKIASAKPKKLFLIADGPNLSDSNDIKLCNRTRAIIDDINWECEVLRNYSSRNIGCNNRIITGLDWLFSLVDECIILEDDCLPDISFFKFCQELLTYYEQDERIMMVTGNNPLGNWIKGNATYHFSNFGGVWGWATWKRAWNLFQPASDAWVNKNTHECIKNVLVNKVHSKHRLNKCIQSFNSQKGSWDYKWSFARLLNSGLTIVPNKNLISNIGFSKKASHTKNESSSRANEPIDSITFPIIHPLGVYPDRYFDTLKFETTHSHSNNNNKLITVV